MISFALQVAYCAIRLLVATSDSMPVYVLAYKRCYSTQRSLVSLDKLYKECNWNGDLTILIDGPSDMNIGAMKIAVNFDWTHGNKTVVVHENNIGIMRQHLWAHYAESEYWLVIEDDVEISPIACHFVTAALPLVDNNPNVYGMSLTAAQWQIGVNEKGGWRRLDLISYSKENMLFYFPAVSTWAQIYKRLLWNDWIRFTKAREAKSIEGSIYEKWYRQRPKSVWSRDFQYFVNAAEIYNLHFLLPDDQVLAYTHHEIGANSAFTKVPKGILAFDKSHVNGLASLTPKKYSYCFDNEESSPQVMLYHNGLSYELHRNHYCFLKMKRCLNIKISYGPVRPASSITGLDYNGDMRLWTVKTLRRHGLYVINEHYECSKFECLYKKGLYPDLISSYS